MYNLYISLMFAISQTFYDAEARVAGYVDGTGRLVGSTGALRCEMESGKKFNVGTGLSDKQRRKPPMIGTIITYRFQELTRDGVPRFVTSKQIELVTLTYSSHHRFPSYIGEAIDKDKPKDAEVPEHRKVGAKSTLAAE